MITKQKWKSEIKDTVTVVEVDVPRDQSFAHV